MNKTQENIYEEIRLSRALAMALSNHIEDTPKEVQDAYEALRQLYVWQIENGIA